MNNNFYLMCIQHLCEYAIGQKEENDLASVLAIFLTCAMQTYHTKFGFGIQHSIFLLKQLNEHCTLYLEPIVVMISQFLLECRANCYEPILELCLNLTKKNCCTFVWGMLQCAVLSIFPYSTKIESDVIEIVESTPSSSLVGSKKALADSKKSSYIRHLSRSEARIQVAIATSELAQRLQRQSIEKFSDPCRTSNSSMLADAIFLLKCAAFWRSGDITALDAAVQYVSSTKLYAQPLLTLLLKKLTTPSDGKTKLAILYHLPSLAIDKVIKKSLKLLSFLNPYLGVHFFRRAFHEYFRSTRLFLLHHN